ncbi:uncharacterized protein LOC110983121 [Acanthaster planci]|uniref:Uncharacterized protein LOC110983121 n=1 Tax=Acanthaster planci TaxID=133434 RepID=A0A8B7YZ49_ACAPL|nr:uncharacterized protein LOC110983121 [Acanthaster planci]
MTTMWKLMALAATLVTVSASALMESDLKVLPSKEEQLLELFREDLAEMTPDEIAKFLLIDSQFVSASEVRGEGVTGKCTLSREALSAECCTTLSFKVFWKRHTVSACAFVQVLKKVYGLHLKITAARRIIYDKEVSAREPPAICIGVPKIRVAKVCLDFHEVQWRNGFHACVNFEVRIPFKTLLDVRLGCIDF